MPISWLESNQCGIETRLRAATSRSRLALESNQCGIETSDRLRQDSALSERLNRTNVELKQGNRRELDSRDHSLNRTNVELKLPFS